MDVAPTVPARIGWENGPWHLKDPSRSHVNSGTPPKTENTFLPVACSNKKVNDRGITMIAMITTVFSKS